MVRLAHVVTAGRTSRFLLGALRRIPGWVDDRSATAIDPAHVDVLGDLRRNGVVVLDGLLSPDDVSALCAFARTAPGFAARTTGGRLPATFDARPDDVTALHLSRTFTLANEHVQKMLAHPTVLAIAQAYLGATPVVQAPSLYWTFPTADLPDDIARDQARWFHIDYDGLAAVRLHVYLTDVAADSGPMEYVRGSHRPRALAGRRFHGADFGLPHDIVDDRFGHEAVAAVTGPAGTAFLSDSQGLHRGTAPRTGHRLFMVIPISAGSFATHIQRRREVPVRDEEFGRLVREPNGPLRLFTAATATTPVPTARLARG